MEAQSYEVLIVGAGTGGITVAAQLAKKNRFSRIAIIEPSSYHYYQPIWTLVGGGVFPREVSRREQSEYIPRGVEWIQESVASFEPEDHALILANRQKLKYKYLVVSPGMEIFWDRISGLKESIGKNGVCSNYSYETVSSTWETIRGFTGGRAIFTFPNTPIKCGGAPQKIMYLAEDYFRKIHVREKTQVLFVSAGASIFAVKKYADALNHVISTRGMETLYKHNLVEIRGEDKIAIFENVETKEKKEFPFDMIHVTPPMGAPACVRYSRLANPDGFVDVNKQTLQHVRYPNVFGLGDSSSLPTSRTGAAIRKQAPTLVANLLSLDSGKPLEAKYDGYTSCPLVTGYGKLILAEFDYEGNPKESFPFDQSKERFSMYLLKKYVLPVLYWDGMLKGKV